MEQIYGTVARSSHFHAADLVSKLKEVQEHVIDVENDIFNHYKK